MKNLNDKVKKYCEDNKLVFSTVGENIISLINEELFQARARNAALTTALEMAGNACGISTIFLEFHGKPSKQLKNCIANMLRQEEMAENSLSQSDDAALSAVRGAMEAMLNTVQFYNIGEFDVRIKDLENALDALKTMFGNGK